MAAKEQKLTIGLATYDDYDGVYFTIQSVRCHHPEVAERIEFVILDNNPGGPCADALERLSKQTGCTRYVPYRDRVGTAVRDQLFELAQTDWVLCLDSHVLLMPGSIKQLIRYFEANPKTRDLLQGPLLMDNLETAKTHFEPVWRDGMYGIWATDELGTEPTNPPFEIPMQGLGVFACRKDAWLGFNPRFKGFGGEEGYIHEKFRQAGHKTLCLPFLRWVHRFDRPMGTKYPNVWKDRLQNYLIGWTELGLDKEAVSEHFQTIMDPKLVKEMVDRVGSAPGMPAAKRKGLARHAKALSDYLGHCGVKHWLDYGSLLGAVRDGRIIPHDQDFDFGFSSDHTQQLVQGVVNFLGEHDHWTLLTHPSLGNPDDLIKLRTPSNGHIDLFKIEQQGSVAVDRFSRETIYYFHLFELDEIKLEGHDFPCPRYLNTLLRHRYGETWRTPRNWYEGDGRDGPHAPKQPITVVVDGVFDLFHYGHIRLLKRARQIYDHVIVGLHSDETARAYKRQPRVPYPHRLEMLHSCKYVDAVFENFPHHDEVTPDFLDALQVDYLLHGKETLLVDSYPGCLEQERLHYIAETEGYSTTQTIESARVNATASV